MAGMNVVAQLIDRVTEAVNPRGTQNGDAYTAKRIPDFTTAVMDGKVFEFLDTTTTVALVARPSTTASLTFQNPSTSGKHYVIFGLKIYTDVVPASLGLVTVWHCVHKLPVALLTRDLVLQGTGAGTAMCLKGGVSYSGSAVVDRGLTTVIDDGWIPTELNLLNNIASTNFVSGSARLGVPVVLHPGTHHSLQTLATVVTFESSLGVTWGEFAEADLY